MLAKNKLNSIETLMSLAIMHLEISHEESKMVVDEEKDYDNQKLKYQKYKKQE